MATFPFVEVKDDWKAIFGEPGKGTRIWRRIGNQQELERWFDALCEHIGAFVSPGGAAARAHVSRAAVHKRLRTGGLTAFVFHAPEDNVQQPWYLRILGNDTRGLCYIPVSECVAWAEELEKRPDREAAMREAQGDMRDMKRDDFIDMPKKEQKAYWKKVKKQVKGERE